MHEVGRILRFHIFRDTIFIVSGPFPLLAFLYWLDPGLLMPAALAKVPTIAILFGAAFSFVIGYGLQELASFLELVRTDAPRRRRLCNDRTSRRPYYCRLLRQQCSLSAEEHVDCRIRVVRSLVWKGVELPVFSDAGSDHTLYLSLLSRMGGDDVVARYYRTIDLKQIGASMCPSLLLTAAVLGVASIHQGSLGTAVLSPLCVVLSGVFWIVTWQKLDEQNRLRASAASDLWKYYLLSRCISFNARKESGSEQQPD